MKIKWALIAAASTGGLLLLTIIISALSGSNPSQPTNPGTTGTVTPAVTPKYTAPDPNQQPKAGMSLITGEICPQTSSGNAPGSMVVAEEIPSRVKHVIFYPGSVAAGTNKFAIEVEPGTYELYIQTLEQEKIALYSQYVNCGMASTCFDHRMVQIEVKAGEKNTSARICDYNWSQPTVSIPRPTTGPTFSPILFTPTPPNLPNRTRVTP